MLSCVCVSNNRTEAREELRRQVGTLRFDLNTLASTKPKDAKKDALAARKEFIRAVSVTLPDVTRAPRPSLSLPLCWAACCLSTKAGSLVKKSNASPKPAWPAAEVVSCMRKQQPTVCTTSVACGLQSSGGL